MRQDFHLQGGVGDYTPCLLFIYLFLDLSLFCSIFPPAPGSLFPPTAAAAPSCLTVEEFFFIFVKGLYYQCFSAATPEQSVPAMLTNQSLI